MTLNESDTRAKLIDPALHARGWTEDLIKREETTGAIEIHGDRARRQGKERVDYALRTRVANQPQPAVVTPIEAKFTLKPYHDGEESRRYYQDAAIKAIVENLARSRSARRTPSLHSHMLYLPNASIC